MKFSPTDRFPSSKSACGMNPVEKQRLSYNLMKTKKNGLRSFDCQQGVDCLGLLFIPTGTLWNNVNSRSQFTHFVWHWDRTSEFEQTTFYCLMFAVVCKRKQTVPDTKKMCSDVLSRGRTKVYHLNNVGWQETRSGLLAEDETVAKEISVSRSFEWCEERRRMFRTLNDWLFKN